MHQPNVIWAWHAADRPTPPNGLRYARRHQVMMLRRRYRLLRTVGLPAWLARDVLWSTANEAIHDTTFVSYFEAVGQ